eukprot:TRINITY_DN15990_c0_g1_i2.p1 TRINITY_DN15990_c0_g1~~TRINITY_DN15990_c0_g1_i2.p1  ORF type:complete len:234 (+),score=64.51 TRINITY_DN15990_c0_g1_i2:462-1163(+)
MCVLCAQVILGDKALTVFKKVHVLPYKDTFTYNYDFMYHHHLVPYFETGQTGEFTTGFEFHNNGVRFQVVGVQPENTHGVVGKNTEVFYEGPAIERKVLERLHLLPFEAGLPDRYRPTRLTLDDKGLVRDYVRPHFEQRSAEVAPGEIIDIKGVSFKVIACRPTDGGGVGKDTELVCNGVALKPAASAKAKGKAKAKATAGGGGYPASGSAAPAATAGSSGGSGSDGQSCCIS